MVIKREKVYTYKGSKAAKMRNKSVKKRYLKKNAESVCKEKQDDYLCCPFWKD